MRLVLVASVLVQYRVLWVLFVPDSGKGVVVGSWVDLISRGVEAGRCGVDLAGIQGPCGIDVIPTSGQENVALRRVRVDLLWIFGRFGVDQGRYRATLGRCRPISAQIWSKSGQLWPPHLIESGQIWCAAQQGPQHMFGHHLW